MATWPPVLRCGREAIAVLSAAHAGDGHRLSRFPARLPHVLMVQEYRVRLHPPELLLS
jgi:hypothetical protein